MVGAPVVGGFVAGAVVAGAVVGVATVVVAAVVVVVGLVVDGTELVEPVGVDVDVDEPPGVVDVDGRLLRPALSAVDAPAAPAALPVRAVGPGPRAAT